MYLIVTRTFPPELGGMQNLMWGLARSLSKLNLIKVFADYHENHEEFDKSVSFSIERVSGMKLIRKYRKSYMINDYLDQNNKVECIIADHWKSLELIKTNKKKYKYTEAKVLNEFIGSLLKNLIVNRRSKTIQKLLKSDPLIRKYDTQMQSITKDLMRGVEKARKTDPVLDKIIKDIESGKYDK